MHRRKPQLFSVPSCARVDSGFLLMPLGESSDVELVRTFVSRLLLEAEHEFRNRRLARRSAAVLPRRPPGHAIPD